MVIEQGCGNIIGVMENYRGLENMRMLIEQGCGNIIGLMKN